MSLLIRLQGTGNAIIHLFTIKLQVMCGAIPKIQIDNFGEYINEIQISPWCLCLYIPKSNFQSDEYSNQNKTSFCESSTASNIDLKGWSVEFWCIYFNWWKKFFDGIQKWAMIVYPRLLAIWQWNTLALRTDTQKPDSRTDTTRRLDAQPLQRFKIIVSTSMFAAFMSICLTLSFKVPILTRLWNH